MNPMTRLFVRVYLMLVGTLVVSLPALAMTNEESVQILKLKEFVLPIYPTSVFQDGHTTGMVTAVISHDVAGQPTDVLVIDSTHERYTEAVREAVSHWRFFPAANVGAMQAPLVRFFFISKGVVLLQSPGMRPPLAGYFISDKVLFPTFGSLDAPPKALEQPMPVFPAALRGRVPAGTATVTFFVDATGHARAAVVTEATNPEFAEAARVAVDQWRYEAPLQNGRPVVAMGNWTFRFGGPTGS